MDGSKIDVPDLLVYPTAYRRDKDNLVALVERCILRYITVIDGASRSFHDRLQARIADEE
jgi:hypothetical protein